MAVDHAPCVAVAPPPSPLSIQLPGGITLKSMPISGAIAATELNYVQAMMAQLAPALAALQPIFVLIDTVTALRDTVAAIPGLIALDVDTFTDALGRVVEGVTTLAGMAPQASVPVLVRDLVAFLVAVLGVLEDELDVIVSAEADAAQVLADAATAPDAYKDLLKADGECMQAQAAAQLQHAVAAIGPVQSLLSIIGLLSQMVPGIPGMPDLGDLTGSATEVKAVIGALRDALDVLSF